MADPSQRERAFEYATTQVAKAELKGRIVLPRGALVMILNDSLEFDRRVRERGPDQALHHPLSQHKANYILAERTYAYAEYMWGNSAAKIEVDSRTPSQTGAAVLGIIRDLPVAECVRIPSEMLPAERGRGGE